VDAAKAVTVPAEGSTFGDPTRGPAPGATGAGGSVPSSGSTTTAKPAPVGLSAPKLTRTLRAGATGQIVRVVQQRLAWTGLSVRDTGVLDGATVGAVRKFEVKQLLSVDGRVDRTTYARLLQVTRRGAALDPRCAGAEHVLCIDKSQKVLRYLVGGKLVMLLDARFGSPELPTREGVFSVYYKSRYQVSTLYHTPMPYAMFFSGGQAVHYSKFFAAVGYQGQSHGCVNVRDEGAISKLFDQVSLGTKVVIYRTSSAG
jgi:hypothetical protein